jgi:hypothetical protein
MLGVYNDLVFVLDISPSGVCAATIGMIDMDIFDPASRPLIAWSIAVQQKEEIPGLNQSIF